MNAFEIARYSVSPDDADELQLLWSAAVDAIRERFDGLLEANLVRIDDGTWMDIWRWETYGAATAAAAEAMNIPAAAKMFALIQDPSSIEHGDIVQQR